MTIEARSYRSKAHLYMELGKISDKFDVNTSLAMPVFSFATTDGKQYQNRILKDFLEDLNKACGTEFLVGKSVTRRNAFVLFLETGEVKDEQIIEPTPETKTEAEPKEEEKDKTEEEAAQVDLDKAQSFYDESDKKGSKAKLEEYAREFDIELDKRKSFESMMTQLKEA